MRRGEARLMSVDSGEEAFESVRVKVQSTGLAI
jgi:hypothetical protein